jgi:hypothetical protein
MLGHFGGGFLPEGLTAVLVDADVAEEGEFVGFWGDEDQHGIAIGGAVQFQSQEMFVGCGGGIVNVMMADEDADDSGGFGFGIGDGFGDRVVVEFVEEMSGFHFLPASAGSAAAEGSAATTEASPTAKSSATESPAASAKSAAA